MGKKTVPATPYVPPASQISEKHKLTQGRLLLRIVGEFRSNERKTN